jgi:FixJ family two-component response regulator
LRQGIKWRVAFCKAIVETLHEQDETVDDNLPGLRKTVAPTVLVVDDDEHVRESLRQLLSSAGLNASVFSRGEALIEALQEGLIGEGPACIVLDVRLRGLSGLMVQQELSRRGIAHPVIFISGYGDIVMTVKAMKAGAVDFLTKPLRDQDLLDAVAEAVNKDRVRLADATALQDLQERWLELTPRQRQVMNRCASGVPARQIADELGVSEITVRVYRGEGMKRLGVGTLAEFRSKARLLGLPVGEPVRPAPE